MVYQTPISVTVIFGFITVSAMAGLAVVLSLA